MWREHGLGGLEERGRMFGIASSNAIICDASNSELMDRPKALHRVNSGSSVAQNVTGLREQAGGLEFLFPNVGVTPARMH
jgi:hypothetical protein